MRSFANASALGQSGETSRFSFLARTLPAVGCIDNEPLQWEKVVHDKGRYHAQDWAVGEGNGWSCTVGHFDL
jgi:hypothetical protein